MEEPVLPFPTPTGYTLLAEVGRGGAGVVWRARQDGLGREVALKVLAAGLLASESERVRLRREAEAMARMRHPHIVAIHEVGEVEGYVFLAMELLEGGTLADRLTRGPLQPRAAAAFLRDAADAVFHAHERGVIHRDIKPANILLDQLGAPHLADFGLAKLMPPLTGTPGQLPTPFELTLTGHPLGTVNYLAPEQAGGSPREAGPPSDIHGLGAVLYHCLSGRPPFLGPSFAETLRQVTDEDPPALRVLNPAIPRDLETISQKCLRKDPSHRYSTAAELRDDLDRFLNGHPVKARPTSATDKTMRLARRHPVGSALVLALAMVLTGWMISVRWQLRNLAVANQRLTERDVVQAMEIANLELDQNELGPAVSRLARAARGEAMSEAPLRRLGALLNQRSWLLPDLELGPDTIGADALCFGPNGESIAIGRKDQRGLFVQRYLLPSGKAVGEIWRPDLSDLEELSFSPAGDQIVAWSSRGEFRTSPLVANATTFTTSFRPNREMSPDGSRMLVVTNAGTGWAVTFLVAPTNPSVVIQKFPNEVPTGVACWSPGGQSSRFITEFQGGIRIRDGTTGNLLIEAAEMGGFVQALAWTPDGRGIAIAPLGGPVSLWSLREAPPEVAFHRVKSSVFRNLEWSPDGRFAVFSSDAPGTWLLEPEVGGTPVFVGPWWRATFAHRSDYLLLANPKGQLARATLPDLAVSDLGVQLPGGADRLALSADDRWLAVATTNQFLSIFEMATHRRWAGPVSINPGGSNTWNLHRVFGLGFSPDGRSVGVASAQSIAGIWKVPGLERRFFLGTNAPFTSLAFSPDGRWLALGSMLGSAWLVDVAHGDITQVLPHSEEVFHVEFSADSRRLVSSDRNGKIRIWGVPGGRLELLVKTGNFQSQWAGFVPEMEAVAAINFDGDVTWWDSRIGQRLGDPVRLGFPLARGAVRPGYGSLAVGGPGGSLWLIRPPIPKGKVPPWVPDLAEALVGLRILDDGSLEKIPPARLRELRNRLGSVTTATDWDVVARRFAVPKL